MANPFNTSDAHIPLDDQDQDAILLSSHAPETMHTTTTTTIVTPEKHLLYVEDYDSLPPSYSVAQQQQQQQHGPTGDVYSNDGSTNEASELETAPLMAAVEEEIEADDHYHCPPTAPSMDQMEFGLPHDVHHHCSKHTTRKKRCTIFRVYLAFAIFAIGITLMSAILAVIDCYNSCKEQENCDQRCPRTRREGFTAFCYITFILSSIALMCKIVQRLLC